MLTKRGFFGCALCAAIALRDGRAEAQTPTTRRTILQSMDVPGTNLVSHLVIVEFPPNGGNPRHTHPGVTTGLILEGRLELEIDGMAGSSMTPGQGLSIPNARPHVERAGPEGCKVAVSFVVEKDKPLASPA